MIRRKRSMILIAIVLSISIGIAWRYVYLFCHSTPERVIRTDLFFVRHHFVDAFRTKISEYPIRYKPDIARYVCKDPAIGPDFYSVDYKYLGKFKFWYIYWPGTGGG